MNINWCIDCLIIISLPFVLLVAVLPVILQYRRLSQISGFFVVDVTTTFYDNNSRQMIMNPTFTVNTSTNATDAKQISFCSCTPFSSSLSSGGNGGENCSPNTAMKWRCRGVSIRSRTQWHVRRVMHIILLLPITVYFFRFRVRIDYYNDTVSWRHRSDSKSRSWVNENLSRQSWKSRDAEMRLFA